MDIEQFRQAGYRAIDRICDYFYSLEKRSVVADVEPGYLRQVLPSTAPERGEDFTKIEEDYQKYILPGLTHWQHPSFFASYPVGCTFEGILGELYANCGSNPGFNWLCSPACTELEAVVTDWAAKMLDLDSAFLNSSEIGAGVMQTSASDSVIVAVVAARSLYLRHNPEVDINNLVIYLTSQTHSVGAKAGLVLGIKCRTLEVNSEDQYALRFDTLQKALTEDQKAGKHPFILIATLGTTSSGTIDRLDEIAPFLKERTSLWLHIDAAWAGVALVCPEYRDLAYLDYINRYADSFCTNFHKWGLLNFDASVLWARDRKNLTDALDVTPEFLRTKHGDAGTVVDYRNMHTGLSRRFRSLKFWFVLRGYGVEGLRAHIRKSIELNKYFSAAIESSDVFDLVTAPFFAISVFHMKERALDGGVTISSNSLTKKLFERISTRKDILLTQTILNGVFCIRFAVGAERTETRHIDAAIQLLSMEAQQAFADLVATSRQVKDV